MAPPTLRRDVRHETVAVPRPRQDGWRQGEQDETKAQQNYEPAFHEILLLLVLDLTLSTHRSRIRSFLIVEELATRLGKTITRSGPH